jgi:hypothetical protein
MLEALRDTDFIDAEEVKLLESHLTQALGAPESE